MIAGVVSHGCVFVFFLVIRRPAGSTLFPYTTLFRSWSVLRSQEPRLARSEVVECSQTRQPQRFLRSEEHTSELQSLAYLVCRLLLEKKNAVPDASLWVTVTLSRRARGAKPPAIATAL